MPLNVPGPKKVNNKAVDEMAEKLTVTLEVTKTSSGSGKNTAKNSTGKATLMTVTVPKGKTQNAKNVVVHKDAKEIVELVDDIKRTFLKGDPDKKSGNKKKRPPTLNSSSTDSASSGSCTSCSCSCSCSDCEDSSFTSVSSDSSSGCSTRSSSDKCSSHGTSRKKRKPKSTASK